MKKSSVLLTLLLLWGCFPPALAQTIEVQARDQSLMRVLTDLNEEYGIQFSATDRYLYDCRVTLYGSFASPAQAMEALLQPCRLTYKTLGEVFIISPSGGEIASETDRPYFRYQGLLIDYFTGEPLPFAVIEHDGYCLLSDRNGYFALESDLSQTSIRVRHLAYQTLDTLLLPAQDHLLALTGKEFCLEEVVIERNRHGWQERYPIEWAVKEGTLEPGFYRDFNEFLDNAPSVPLQDLTFTSKKAWVMSGGPLIVQRFDIEKERAKGMGPILGFSDGRYIYLNIGQNEFSRPFVFKPKTKFARMTIYDRFIYYERMGVTYSSNGQGGVSRWTYKERRVIDLETGEEYTLTRRKLRKILAHEPVLLEQFEEESRKGKKLKDYLEKYAERQEQL